VNTEAVHVPLSELREQLAVETAKEVHGQFTVEAWAGGWMAQAFQGGPGSSVCLFANDRASCLAAVAGLYERGKVPMNAIPSSQYFADAIAYQMELASRALATGETPR
jgi:hypothetical protein